MGEIVLKSRSLARFKLCNQPKVWYSVIAYSSYTNRCEQFAKGEL